MTTVKAARGYGGARKKGVVLAGTVVARSLPCRERKVERMRNYSFDDARETSVAENGASSTDSCDELFSFQLRFYMKRTYVMYVRTSLIGRGLVCGRIQVEEVKAEGRRHEERTVKTVEENCALRRHRDAADCEVPLDSHTFSF